GRCDSCAGPLFDAEVAPESLAAAHVFLGRPGVEIAPKKLWPTGMEAVGVPLKGRIAPAEQIRPGRAVGRLSDLGWGARLRALVAPDATDGALAARPPAAGVGSPPGAGARGCAPCCLPRQPAGRCRPTSPMR